MLGQKSSLLRPARPSAAPRVGGLPGAPCTPIGARRLAVRAADDGKDVQADSTLEDRIAAGEFSDTGSTKERLTRPVRRFLAQDPVGIGRWLALQLAQLGREWRAVAARRMPEARGDIREIVGQPVFVPLYRLAQRYGKIFRLSFGPKTFVVISDPAYTKQILSTNADKYSKGLLSEILDFVMGTGLIPADGEVWKTRRRAVVPALHRKYVASMVGMFGDCALHGAARLGAAADAGTPVEMENWFSRLALDIIGKAVFNYDFDSLTHDDPVIQAVYTALREAEYRSTAPIAYWNLPPARWLVPRQRRVTEALKIVNATLDSLIAKAKALVDEEDRDWEEEFLSEDRDWEGGSSAVRLVVCLLVDSVIGDAAPTVEQLAALKFTTRVINEGMRLYPQPPVLIRRALVDDKFDDYEVTAGSDIFISVWNLHRDPANWDRPHEFDPDRFPVDAPMPNEVTEAYKYLPFGGGRRKCVGDQFALFEAVVGLGMLLRRFEFERAPDAPPVGMTTGATIHTTNGLWMTIKRRNAPPAAGRAAGAATPSAAPAGPVPALAAAASAAAAPAAAGEGGGGCPFAAAFGGLAGQQQQQQQQGQEQQQQEQQQGQQPGPGAVAPA
ncbi:cytochrome P450 [Raphidocelis subcapitata]|uniref:Cytochrome P450 n=1 Tax=Raphidocelis subcapitata TaxID=307507 RepID=A0A2V0P9H0_9CHLO|nr:cytochrome P450 [Raphidocelis subcapitata]|eukprot:GBF96486.1 cytochrome P450 [Raphidocelis subcapitata]